MAIPVLKLNLAPPPTLWRRQHSLLSWSALALGALTFALVVGLTWHAYRQANEMGRGAFLLSRQTQESLARQGSIQAQLRSINVQKELPRWKLAERILGERSSPWSRLTAELERSLVQDVRIRTLQRNRGSDQIVMAKLKGEARSREAEAAFVESIQKNGFFSQVILERESERPGGGIEFEFTLPVAATPPPYAPLPKFGTPRAQPTPRATQPMPAKATPLNAKAAPRNASPSGSAPSAATAKPLPLSTPQRSSLVTPSGPSPESIAPRLRNLREPRPQAPGNREERRDRPAREVRR